MPTFSQDGNGSIANAILQTRTTQPKSRITHPPLAGPDSGVVSGDVPQVISKHGIKHDSCIDLPAFIQRMQLASWTGQAATAVGSNFNWAYVLSDRVPLGRYWEVIYASTVVLGGSGTAIQRPSLYLISPTRSPHENNLPYGVDDTGFFSGQSAADNNGPPVSPVALRVDEVNDGVTSEVFFINAEIVLVRTRKVIVPPGWRLMVYGGNQGNGQGGTLGEQWQLKIVYAEFLSFEDTEIF